MKFGPHMLLDASIRNRTSAGFPPQGLNIVGADRHVCITTAAARTAQVKPLLLILH
jgi:hypothetical protein